MKSAKCGSPVVLTVRILAAREDFQNAQTINAKKPRSVKTAKTGKTAKKKEVEPQMNAD
jgi:hypothetical protein